jgi:hypothetical protein
MSSRKPKEYSDNYTQYETDDLFASAATQAEPEPKRPIASIVIQTDEIPELEPVPPSRRSLPDRHRQIHRQLRRLRQQCLQHRRQPSRILIWSSHLHTAHPKRKNASFRTRSTTVSRLLSRTSQMAVPKPPGTNGKPSRKSLTWTAPSLTSCSRACPQPKVATSPPHPHPAVVSRAKSRTSTTPIYTPHTGSCPG